MVAITKQTQTYATTPPMGNRVGPLPLIPVELRSVLNLFGPEVRFWDIAIDVSQARLWAAG
jgi:hypothetical protein